jgi:predicted DCC family thiol-disulfide oxidoreductase YuxK
MNRLAVHTSGPLQMQRSRAMLLYDGQCPLCRRSVAILKKLDWFRRIDYRDARDEANIPSVIPPLQAARLLEEMHLVTPDGRRVYHGFGAFRWLAWRMPLLWLVAPLLYLPGVPQFGQRVYLWVARNRFQLVPCRDGVCELPRKPATSFSANLSGNNGEPQP